MAGMEPLQAAARGARSRPPPARPRSHSRGPRRRAQPIAELVARPRPARGRSRRSAADVAVMGGGSGRRPRPAPRSAREEGLGIGEPIGPGRLGEHCGRPPHRPIARANAGASSGQPGRSSQSLGPREHRLFLLSLPPWPRRVSGRRQRFEGEMKKERTWRPSPSNWFSSENLGPPLPGRPFLGRPYSAARSIGMSTQTNLRPSLPSRNATRPSVSANRV